MSKRRRRRAGQTRLVGVEGVGAGFAANQADIKHGGPAPARHRLPG